MNGILLFCGFLAGIAATIAVFALLPQIQAKPAAKVLSAAEPEAVLPENKELMRLQKQLAEIDRYSGGELGGK